MRGFQVFSQEMSLAVDTYGGYIFKYVGDAVIALFPSGHDDAARVSGNVINCSRSIVEILKEYVSPALETCNLPRITAKIAFDYGNVLVVSYGIKTKYSHIDIAGRTISIVAKMLPYTKPPTNVIAGQTICNIFPEKESRELFADANADAAGWSYIDERNGRPYKLYLLKMNRYEI